MGKQDLASQREVSADVDVAEVALPGQCRQHAVNEPVVHRNVGGAERRPVQPRHHVRRHDHQVTGAKLRPVCPAWQQGLGYEPLASGVSDYDGRVSCLDVTHHRPPLTGQALQVALRQAEHVDEHVVVGLEHEAGVRAVVVDPAQRHHGLEGEVEEGVLEVPLHHVPEAGLLCVDADLVSSVRPVSPQQENRSHRQAPKDVRGRPRLPQNPPPLEVGYRAVDNDQQVHGSVPAQFGVLQDVPSQERVPLIPGHERLHGADSSAHPRRVRHWGVGRWVFPAVVSVPDAVAVSAQAFNQLRRLRHLLGVSSSVGSPGGEVLVHEVVLRVLEEHGGNEEEKHPGSHDQHHKGPFQGQASVRHQHDEGPDGHFNKTVREAVGFLFCCCCCCCFCFLQSPKFSSSAVVPVRCVSLPA